MGAHVEHKFDKDFLLDEERLRKIRSLIDERLTKSGVTAKPLYKVSRGDSFFYETESIEDVIKEDNEDWRRVTRLEIKFEEKDRLKFAVTFSGGGVTLLMEGADRDDVFLLFSDLKDYLENEVATRGLLSNRVSRVLPTLLLLGFIGFLLLIGYIFGDNPTKELRNVTLQSTDVVEKLDYLIKYRSVGGSSVVLGLVIAGMVVYGIVIFGLSKVAGFCYPRNDFLFGKRQESFNKKKSIVSKIFWGIIVTLAVSVIAGLIVWWVTR